MRLEKIILLVVINLLLFTVCCNAQKIKLLEGSLAPLKGQKAFDLKFTYDSMLIGRGTPEHEYLEKKKSEWDLKEQGRGKAFATQWYEARERRYEPSFIKNFEEFSNLKVLQKDAKYTIILKTKRTEGGWNAGAVGHPGEIDGELWIVESGNETTVVAKVGFYNSAGIVSNGGDFEMTTRIQSAYELAGKWIGIYFYRKLK